MSEELKELGEAEQEMIAAVSRQITAGFEVEKARKRLQLARSAYQASTFELMTQSLSPFVVRDRAGYRQVGEHVWVKDGAKV